MTHTTASDPHNRLMRPAKLVLRRWKQRNALTVFALAALVVTLVVLGLRLAGSTFPALPFVFAGGTFGLLITMMVNRGAGARLLWQIDRSAQRDQAYATATRLSLDADDPGPVGRVLLRDEAAKAATIDPRAVVSVPGPIAITAAVATVVLVGVNFWLADQRAAQSLTHDAPAAPAADDDTAPLADTLDAIATRMAEDAAATENDYLAAVARALSEKSDALADAPDDAALQQDVADLLEHARRAYGETPPNWLGESGAFSTQQVAENFEDMLAQQARASERAAERSQEGYVDIYERDDERLQQLYSGRDADELISNVEGDVRMADNDLAPGTAPDEGTPRRMDDAELQMLGGAPVGAAMESGRGDSRLAGGGSQELQDDTTSLGPDSTTSTDMTLAGNPDATGNRIRIDAAPPMAAGDPAATSDGAVAGRFDSTQIARAAMGAARTEIPASARGLVARYLDRATANSAAGGQTQSSNGSAE
ncbi:hypothetical protein BVG79_02254 [Ketogulonicigenium robustum]|uniref:Uncharacterized protein n=1 Tax=Ketogulonicigenium robustum TaxID=92947 RepID=A0A1W6P2B9_9RHOB|nr:hypothetical protein [Ketogulonicigenium robustum]ARO15594.1 hypothetical protein BVG79_02254 [Ketogulonicigenium robustum]